MLRLDDLQRRLIEILAASAAKKSQARLRRRLKPSASRAVARKISNDGKALATA